MSSHGIWQSALAAGALCAVLIGCGSQPPPAKTPEPARAAPQHEPASTMSASADIGALDEDQVTQTFRSCLDAFKQCLSAGASRVQYIGGSVDFAITVDQSGHLSDAHLRSSTLGDRNTEQCMLGVLRSKTWPRPVGGKSGLAEKSFDFDPPSDSRPATDWTSDRVDDTLKRVSSEIRKCKGDVSGDFSATVYVDTDGKALSVGMAPPSAQGESAIHCLVDILKSAKYPSPGSWPAKVSFTL